MMKPVTATIALGASLVGAGALALYFLLREDEERHQAIEYIPGSRSNSSREVTADIFIPEEKVAVFIGRAGSNIKEIERKTCTKISHRAQSKDGRFMIYTIKGKAERVKEAETVINEFIVNQPDIKNIEIFVPKMALGRIYGRDKTTLLSMQQISGARIKISDEKESKGDEVSVAFHGTPRQIALAKSLVEEKVEEDRELREGILQRVRSPRSPARQFCITNSPYKEPETGRRRPVEKLNATTQNGFLEVFVSAMKDPGRFWIQKVGPPCVELDKLVDKMTEFYNMEENLEVYKPKEVMEVGSMAAAQFSVDGKWYRAFVRDVVVDDYDPLQSKLDIFFVDYGDDELKSQVDVYNLNSQFLRLRHQAIECSLAGVDPVGGEWADEASDLFAELSYASRWKVVMAKVQGFKEPPKERASSPVPQVVLVDTSRPEDIVIADELVKHGFATKPSPTKTVPVLIPAGEEEVSTEEDFTN